MNSSIRPFIIVLLAAALLWTGACSSSQPKPRNQALAEVLRQSAPTPPSAMDPCPEQLHKISGSILFFYYNNRRLPSTLDELKANPGPDPAASYACPVDGKPYVYVPGGMVLPDVRGRVLVYDAEPSKGWRWTVIMDELVPPKAPVTRVVAIPEARFSVRPIPGDVTGQ